MAVSWPFDAVLTQDEHGNPQYSRAYSSDAIARILSRYFSNGVFLKPATSLQVVQHQEMTVLVKAGAANVNGRHFDEELDRVLTVQAAHAEMDRIDTVALRLNLEQSVLSIDLYVLMGTAAVVPQPPQLTRNASLWELGLANLFIAKGNADIPQHRITDTRMNSERCGLVTSVIGELDTTTLYAQVQSDLARFRQEEQAAFTGWRTLQSEAFETWFAQTRDTLAGDAAGNLLALIQQRAPVQLSALLPMSGWSATKPYRQTVAVPGIQSGDTPLADVALGATAQLAAAQLAAYMCIGRIDAGNGTLEATCYSALPDADIPLQLKVVR